MTTKIKLDKFILVSNLFGTPGPKLEVCLVIHALFVFNQVTNNSFEMRIAHHHVFHQKLIQIHRCVHAINRLDL